MMRVFKTWLEKHVKSSYNQLRGKPWYTGGEPSKQEQRDKLSYAFLAWAAQTYDLRRLEEPNLTFPQVLSDYQEVFMYAPQVGLENFFSLLKEMLGWLRNERDISELRRLAGEYGAFLVMAVLRPVFRYLPKRYLDAKAFRVLHHQFFFLSRITLETPGLEEKSAAEWLAFECQLGTQPPVATLPHAPALRSVIRNWFGNFRVNVGEPGFSAGSTADCGRLLCDKLAKPYLTAELFNLLRENGYQCVNEVVLPNYEFVSKYVTVPKNALTRRTISMEPAYCNYWQTSLDRQLRRYIAANTAPGMVGCYVDLNDQSKNRDKALSASRTRKLVTADLSAASDSITLELVKYLFSGTPLLRWLLATRSTSTKILGIKVKLRKFAPMGSRLSFPIESAIFAACAYLAEAMAGIPLHERCAQIYGDDIIIEVEAYGYLKMLLAEFGFVLNESKSFSDSRFRESCGIFAYAGVDVTLPSFSRFGVNGFAKHLSYEELTPLVSLANKAIVEGLDFSRYIYVECIRSHCEPKFAYPTIDRVRDVIEDNYVPENLKHSRLIDASTKTDWGYLTILSWQATNWRMRRRSCKPTEPDFGYGAALLPHRRPMADRGKREAIPERLRYAAWLYQSAHGSATCLFSEDQIALLGPGCRYFQEARTIPQCVETRGEVVMQWTAIVSAD